VDKNQRKTIQVNTNHSIKTVRESVGKLFGIQEFQLRANGDRVLSPENDHNLVKSLGKLKIVTIHAKGSKAGKPETSFCAIISDNAAHIDILFDLISKTDKVYASYAWELLMRLPIHKKQVDFIRGLKFAKTAGGWATVLNRHAIHKQLYNLLVIQEVLSSDTKGRWRKSFEKARGVHELIEAFLQTTPAQTLGLSFISKYVFMTTSLL
jgi:hypothetical protein